MNALEKAAFEKTCHLRNIFSRLSSAIRDGNAEFVFHDQTDNEIGAVILARALGHSGDLEGLLSEAIKRKVVLTDHLEVIKAEPVHPAVDGASILTRTPKAVAPPAPVIAAGVDASEFARAISAPLPAAAPAPSQALSSPPPEPAQQTPRAWSLLGLQALAGRVFGGNFIRDLKATCPTEQAQRRHILFSLRVAGLKVEGLETELSEVLSVAPALTGINAACHATRQAVVDAFLAEPQMANEDLFALFAFVFGDRVLEQALAAPGPDPGPKSGLTMTQRCQATKKPSKNAQRANIISAFKLAGLRVPGVGELDGKGAGYASKAHQQKVDEWLRSRNRE